VQPNILIVDAEDGQPLGSQIQHLLQRDSAFRVDLLFGRPRDTRIIREPLPQVLIAVVPRVHREANGFLSELRSLNIRSSLLPVVAPTALNNGITEILAAAPDFLVTPLKEPEVLLRVRRLVETGYREAAMRRATEACGPAQLIGEDPQLVNLKRRIPIVARFDSTVLLTGETGTGKEKFARALHYSSPRASKPFLPVNCGAIPIELFESELYGHRRGAFTGAVSGQPGLIAEAEGGTLFLDEVETLGMASQVKLLRFLQDQMYYPVGSAKPKQANVWIVASTNIELPLKIQQGTFREDLYYRLAVISLAVPPLRQRPGDIPRLADHFWRMYSARAGRAYQPLSREVMEALRRHNWPGNVRELQNVVQQLAVLSETETVQPKDLPIPQREVVRGQSCSSFAQRKAVVIEEFERRYLTELLRIHQGNVTHAAQEAGKDRRALGRLIKKYRITKHEPHD
jgi:two-component system response regulator GlrR